jgi:hypothetical protein
MHLIPSFFLILLFLINVRADPSPEPAPTPFVAGIAGIALGAIGTAVEAKKCVLLCCPSNKKAKKNRGVYGNMGGKEGQESWNGKGGQGARVGGRVGGIYQGQHGDYRGNGGRQAYGSTNREMSGMSSRDQGIGGMNGRDQGGNFQDVTYQGNGDQVVQLAARSTYQGQGGGKGKKIKYGGGLGSDRACEKQGRDRCNGFYSNYPGQGDHACFWDEKEGKCYGGQKCRDKTFSFWQLTGVSCGPCVDVTAENNYRDYDILQKCPKKGGLGCDNCCHKQTQRRCNGHYAQYVGKFVKKNPNKSTKGKKTDKGGYFQLVRRFLGSAISQGVSHGVKAGVKAGIKAGVKKGAHAAGAGGGSTTARSAATGRGAAPSQPRTTIYVDRGKGDYMCGWVNGGCYPQRKCGDW